METLQQRMAISAHRRATAFNNANLGNDSAAARKKYGTMAHKLPILIHSAGLAQALAFVQSRGSTEQHQLLSDVAVTSEIPGVVSGDALARLSREAELAEYMLYTRRVLAALLWYKRYAESVLGVAPNEDDETDGG